MSLSFYNGSNYFGPLLFIVIAYLLHHFSPGLMIAVPILAIVYAVFYLFQTFALVGRFRFSNQIYLIFFVIIFQFLSLAFKGGMDQIVQDFLLVTQFFMLAVNWWMINQAKSKAKEHHKFYGSLYFLNYLALACSQYQYII